MREAKLCNDRRFSICCASKAGLWRNRIYVDCITNGKRCNRLPPPFWETLAYGQQILKQCLFRQVSRYSLVSRSEYPLCAPTSATAHMDVIGSIKLQDLPPTTISQCCSPLHVGYYHALFCIYPIKRFMLPKSSVFHRKAVLAGFLSALVTCEWHQRDLLLLTFCREFTTFCHYPHPPSRIFQALFLFSTRDHLGNLQFF